MSLVQRFMTGKYKISRQCAGRYVDGIWTEGDCEELIVRGSLQPARPRELNLAEEGTRLRQYWKFFTDLPILPIGTKMLKSADTVVIDGETYKVISVEHWGGTTFPHYKSILYREPEQ